MALLLVLLLVIEMELMVVVVVLVAQLTDKSKPNDQYHRHEGLMNLTPCCHTKAGLYNCRVGLGTHFGDYITKATAAFFLRTWVL